MGKVFIDKVEGKIKKIYVPEVYKDGCMLPEDYVDLICLEVKVGDKTIKLTESRYGRAADLFVGDDIKINKYAIKGDYDEFINELHQYVNTNFCYLNDEEKNKIINQYSVTVDQYNKKPKSLTIYRLDE